MYDWLWHLLWRRAHVIQVENNKREASSRQNRFNPQLRRVRYLDMKIFRLTLQRKVEDKNSKRAYLLPQLSLFSQRILIDGNSVFVEQQLSRRRFDASQIHRHEQRRCKNAPHCHLRSLLVVRQREVSENELECKMIFLIQYNNAPCTIIRLYLFSEQVPSCTSIKCIL